MIASCLHLGGACPPHWVFQGFVALGPVSGETGGGVGPSGIARVFKWGGGGQILKKGTCVVHEQCDT